MAVLESLQHEALAHVTRALVALEKIRVRWRRYPDTLPLANTAAPIEAVLRTAKDVFAAPGGARDKETIEVLPRAILALRILQRDEVSVVIGSLQAAYDAALACIAE